MQSLFSRNPRQTGPIRITRLALSACLMLIFTTSAQAQNDREEQPTPSRGEVGDAALPAPPVPFAISHFTTGVEDREPIDHVTFVGNDVSKIFFFSDLRGLEGTEVTHRWSYHGKTVAEVKFNVRGPRWRVWSSKEMQPDWTGDWTVEIVLGNGEVLASETFTYSAAAS